MSNKQIVQTLDLLINKHSKTLDSFYQKHPTTLTKQDYSDYANALNALDIYTTFQQKYL